MIAKILVVDDEESIRGLAQIILEDNGYRVVTAENGDAAIAIYQKEKPDLVLLDVLMPGMSGIDVCKQLKSQNSRNVPVVMFTVLNGDDDRRMAREARCDGYFLKPFSPEDLVREVETHLRTA